MFNKFSKKETILLLERLELYLSAGLPLNVALEVIAVSTGKKRQESLYQVRDFVEKGGKLSHALRRYIGCNSMICGLLAHGEVSGNLTGSLELARSLLEKDDELRRKCLSALAYPLIIGIFASLLTLGLVRGVMPQIIPMLKSLNVGLPLITRSVIFASEVLMKYGIYILVVVILLVAIFAFAYKNKYKVRQISHAYLIRIPLTGKLLEMYNFSIFLRSLGSLMDSGIPLSQAYLNVVGTTELIPLKEDLRSKISQVEKGVPLGTVLRSKRIPSFIRELVAAGESSGRLSSSLLRSSDILDRDIDHFLKKLTALIEPLMMAGMGTIVGGIALSIMMPIYDVSKVLQK